MNALYGEALRYLGVRKPDEASRTLVAEGFAALEGAVPHHVLLTLPTVQIIEAFGSQALASHLEGCEESVLMAATLGAQADQLIRRAEASDTLRAAVLHACAAAKIEAYCDEVQASIPQALRPRFSPGYGDFPLEAQQILLNLTQANKHIGLYLTDGCMLVPTKSITAVMGLGPAIAHCPSDKCLRCPKLDCAYRGETATCQ